MNMKSSDETVIHTDVDIIPGKLTASPTVHDYLYFYSKIAEITNFNSGDRLLDYILYFVIMHTEFIIHVQNIKQKNTKFKQTQKFMSLFF